MPAGRFFGSLIGRDGAALREAFAALSEPLLLLDANGRLLAATDAAGPALAPLGLPAEGGDALAALAPTDRGMLAAALAEPEPPKMLAPAITMAVTDVRVRAWPVFASPMPVRV